MSLDEKSNWLTFTDSPEYVARQSTPFKAPDITIAELHAAVPAHLWKKSTFWGLFYSIKALVQAYAVYRGAKLIPLAARYVGAPGVAFLWGVYWWSQGLVLCGWWCLAHEAGHGTLTNYSWLNNLIGYILHTGILAPYTAWRESHRKHHKATMSVEREENYVPRTRSEYNLHTQSDDQVEDGEQPGYLAPGRKEGTIDAHELFSDAPLYNLYGIAIMLFFGWQIYLVQNTMGNPMYPPGTNHFQPSSPIFKPRHRAGIVASNIGMLCVLGLLALWTYNSGFMTVFKLYTIPYFLANYHIVLLTYLHHSDPTLPHYRKAQWTFVRGALSTCDRPLYGWIGRWILHNVSHDHVAHHLFSSIPFWNQPQVTACIKKALNDRGEISAYNYDSTNTCRAMFRTFTQCCFIEDEGDIVFYKDRDGVAGRNLAAKQ
ncbi:fatty acid conjugase [Cylindrobasidium torrendii FP15055 ss-10]|uniref:Fatty acid conjugase n=1 Tax=Cylindrobasidium torrendii FP15055 ss-10 TaxID=1314674 RepID=A0A0D7BC15_9AGAR|nr:fatty acid conjugase [Cylindrobasidium torrendii FP15055 ss-10]